MQDSAGNCAVPFRILQCCVVFRHTAMRVWLTADILAHGFLCMCRSVRDKAGVPSTTRRVASAGTLSKFDQSAAAEGAC